MIPCPKCGTNHRGPRDVDLLHGEACQTLARAAEMTTTDAARFMRANFIRIGLELSSFCPNCVLRAQGDVTGSVDTQAIENVRQTEQAMRAATNTAPKSGEAVLSVCTVIPLFGRRPHRDLLDTSAKHDTERKP